MSTTETTSTRGHIASLVRSGETNLLTVLFFGEANHTSVAHHIVGGFAEVDAFLEDFAFVRLGEWEPASENGFTARIEISRDDDGEPCTSFEWCSGIHHRGESFHMSQPRELSTSKHFILSVHRELDAAIETFDHLEFHVDMNTDRSIPLDGIEALAVELEDAARVFRAFAADPDMSRLSL